MPNNSFKSDESFLEKLAVGAAGVNSTIDKLRSLGYQPIELERGSSGYKIWKKIKIKRVRVPDILCLISGKRFESRGKTKLEISMSHSLKDPYRAWNAGMRPDDLVSFILFQKADSTPVNWNRVSPIHFVRIEDMGEAYNKGYVQITRPKGVEEGSEIRVIWPCTTANEDEVVSEITEKFIKLTYLNIPGKQRCNLIRKDFSLIPQCQVGDIVQKNQIIASTVPIYLDPARESTVDEVFFRDQLQSVALSERYTAAKALRFRGFSKLSEEKLRERMLDKDEDVYVQLEAAAALAVHADIQGWEFLENAVNSPFLTVQLETVIVLSEISLPKSEELLIKVLTEDKRDSEIRAGAAWGLGEFLTRKSADALVNTFNLTNPEIKIEAARALLKIAPPQIKYLSETFKMIEPEKRDGIAWTLARLGNFNLEELLERKDDNNLRQWISYIAGYGKNHFSEEQILALCKNDPEVFFAASVLWQLIESWIYNLGEY